MRIFVAADLTPSVRQAVAGLTAALRSDPAFNRLAVRWVPTNNLHLTFRFLGEVEAAGLANIRAALRPDFRQRAFHVTLDQIGVFPVRGAPRVVWLGASRGAPQLRSLHDEVEGRLEGCGFERERRSFSPHVTLGRVKRARGADAHRIGAVLDATAVQVPSWRVDRIVLYESRLSSQGSSYHVVARTVLRPE